MKIPNSYTLIKQIEGFANQSTDDRIKGKYVQVKLFETTIPLKDIERRVPIRFLFVVCGGRVIKRTQYSSGRIDLAEIHLEKLSQYLTPQ